MAMTTCPECGKEVSSLATTCPHCGFPIKTEPTEKTTYQLSVGGACDSALSIILRVVAVIIWIGGLIASIALANQTTYHTSSYNYYSYSETKFSFGYFLVYLLAFGFAGWMEWLLANVVEAIYDTRSMVAGLTLSSTVKRVDAKNIKHIPFSNSRSSASSATVKKASEEKLTNTSHQSEEQENVAQLEESREIPVEEKQTLEAEKTELVSQLKELINQRAAIQSEIAEKIRVIPQSPQIAELDLRLRTYQSEIDSLGRFNGKRKEELSELWESTSVKRNEMIRSMKKTIEENGYSRTRDIVSSIHQIQVRISQIDTELTKDR